MLLTRDTHIEIRHVESKDAEPEGLHLSKAYLLSVLWNDEAGFPQVKRSLDAGIYQIRDYFICFLIGFHCIARRSGSIFQVR